MAGFFLWHDSREYDPARIREVFWEHEYVSGKYLKLGKWNAVVFPKRLYQIENWQIFSEGSAFCIGTFAYKGEVYEKALPVVYADLCNDSLDTKGFWGSFIIVASVKDKIYLIRDGAGLTRLYHIEDLVFSSSYSGLLHSTNRKWTFDRDAATELLMTGVITGSRTLLREIRFVPPGRKLKYICTVESNSATYTRPETRNEALSQQIDISTSFVRKVTGDWIRYLPTSMFDIGVTGGMDCRLVVALLSEYKDRMVFHTHWRKAKDRDSDFRYAGILSRKMGVPLKTVEVTSADEMDNGQLEENFEKAYRLCDGEIRPGCYWDEEYATLRYRTQLTTISSLKFLGFGGEQYRNGEGIPLNSRRTVDSLIKWDLLYAFSGKYFMNKSAAQRIREQIRKDFVPATGDMRSNLESYKEFIRLVQSPSYRSLQANIENKLGFCINPFLDTSLSLASMNAVRFIGTSLDFEVDMIRRLSPEIASIPNAYGFDFSKGEPLKHKMAFALWHLSPAAVKYPIYSAANHHFASSYIPKLSRQNGFIRDLERTVRKLDLPILYEKYRLRRSRGKLLLNLGYFLRRNENIITV